MVERSAEYSPSNLVGVETTHFREPDSNWTVPVTTSCPFSDVADDVVDGRQSDRVPGWGRRQPVADEAGPPRAFAT